MNNPPDAKEHPVARWLARGRSALIFLTRLPLRPVDGPGAGPPAPLAEAAGLFPIAGVVVGVLGALALWLAHGLGLPPMLAALAAVGATVLVTGALHEDGLADVADGFGGGGERERKLAIMRDSVLGSYGALALILSVGARVLALAALAGSDAGIALAAGGLVAAHAAARAPLPAVMAWGRPARGDGLGHDAGRPTGGAVSTALGFGLLGAALAVGPLAGAAALAAAILGVALLHAVARHQIGGYTGDVLGAAEQLAEVLVLLTLVCLA